MNPEQLAERGKATFIRSLDGYVMSEEDYKALLSEAAFQAGRVIKLEQELLEARAEVADLLKPARALLARAYHLPIPEMLEDLRAAIGRVEKKQTMTPQEYDKCFAQGDSINKL